MRIKIDVDGVCADLHTEWLRRYNKRWNDNLTVDKITTWSMHDVVKPECGTKIYDILNEEGLYDNVQPIAGAVAGVNKLREMGHQIMFVSAYFNTDKVAWLERHGFLTGDKNDVHVWKETKEVALINDKSWIKGDFCIDDRLDNLIGENGPIIFDQPWNRADFNAPRVNGWAGVLELIKIRTGLLYA